MMVPIRTGIGMVDRMGLLEVSWYARQLRRMGNGENPKPDESALWSLLASVVHQGVGTFRTKRLRA